MVFNPLTWKIYNRCDWLKVLFLAIYIWQVLTICVSLSMYCIFYSKVKIITTKHWLFGSKTLVDISISQHTLLKMCCRTTHTSSAREGLRVRRRSVHSGLTRLPFTSTRWLRQRKKHARRWLTTTRRSKSRWILYAAFQPQPESTPITTATTIW